MIRSVGRGRAAAANPLLYAPIARVGRRWDSSAPFRPPPIRQRLKPLIPFFIYWTMITSLAVHLLRLRIRSKEELDQAKAQVSVLQGLIERNRRGDKVADQDMQRELEMVGLRERTEATASEVGVLRGGGYVGWREAVFGRKRRKVEDEDERAVQEWVEVVKEATEAPQPAPASPAFNASQSTRTGFAKRAPSSDVYM